MTTDFSGPACGDRGRRDLVAILACVPVAIAAAAVIWLWWRSPIPTFKVFTAVLHGMLLGVALAWAFDRIGVRSRGRRALLGMTGAVVSVVALVFGQYVTDAHEYRDQAQRAVSAYIPVQRQPDANALADYDRNLLQPATGRTGILGYLALKHRGEAWGGWVRLIEATIVIAIASFLGSRAWAMDSPAG